MAASGSARPFRFALIALLLTSVSLGGCRGAREVPPPPPPPVVTITQPVAFPVLSYYEYNGYLESVETVQVKARVRGFLTEVKLNESGSEVREGDEVKEGDLLFRIDPREYAATVKRAEADQLKAAAEVKRTKAEEERARQTLASRATSTEEFQQRVAARETAEAVLKQTEAMLETARLEQSYTEIKAPISGQISRTLVTRGNLVGQGEATLLTTIVKMDQLFVYFDIPERDLVEYQKGRQEKNGNMTPLESTPVEVGVETEKGYPHRGMIDFRENRVDMSTGTVRIRGRIANPRVPPGNVRLLYPGLYARVRVPTGDARQLLVIPEDALMTGQEGRYVYVIGANNVVQKRTVTIGAHVWKTSPEDEGKPSPWTLVETAAATGKPAKSVGVTSIVAIEKGLQPGDKVIVNGLTKARPGTPVEPKTWTLVAPKPPADSAK